MAQPEPPPPAPPPLGPPPGPPFAAPPPSTSALAVVAAVFVALWTIAVAVLAPALAWFVEQSLQVVEIVMPGWVWPVVTVVCAGLIAAPAALLAFVPRPAPVRAAGRLWLLGAAALAVLGAPRAVGTAAHELYFTLLAIAAAGLALLGRRLAGPTPAGAGADPRPVRAATAWWGAAAGLACVLPWALWGALGSIGETILAAVAAAAVGWLASTLLDDRLWAGFAGGYAQRIVLGGLVAGVGLTVLAAGIGASGAHLALLLTMPPLGFAAAALATRGGIWALVGVAAFGPLAFLDPAETALVLNLGTRDAGSWALLAAVVGMFLALAGGGYLSFHRGRTRPVFGIVGTAVLVGAISAVYLGPGQPGLHGDHLFVVLREQADLTGLAQLTDRPERLRQTYRRLVEQADRTQAPLRAELKRWHLGYTPYYLVNGIEVHSGNPAVREWLSRRSDVDRVLLSPRLRPLPEPAPVAHGSAAAPTSPQWNIEAVRADRTWGTGVTGRGIVVGTSDSGVDGTHPALRNGFRGGDDSWYDPWNHSRTPVDHGGHGTHTLGSAVGRSPTGAVPGRDPGEVPVATAPAIGVAPGAEWMGCVNLDRNLGNVPYYLDCLQFMLAPFPYGGDPFRDGRPERAPHVLTNSWGCPVQEGCDATAMRSAIQAITAAGIFFAVAAGNSGPTCGSLHDPPAWFPESVAVAAVGPEGRLADFSSRGPAPDGSTKPDVAAPGVDVLSALPGNTYGVLSGTSMATPHVAGVVALMWSANPKLIGDLARTREILADTAKPPLPTLGADGDASCGTGPDDAYGNGVVDAAAAVEAARKVP